ncbi:EAL domain-containing response regulator [Halomicronema sp. CCY15110]|uniref:GGDEF/EAL domain-containing response regulator n=1 Tax=Halomicronema sp. CCY15110 TaxID=2767773 RepID=UPI00194E9453|nr:EAL domain-containing response regulator [Halomicronema sp. CCY15110]
MSTTLQKTLAAPLQADILIVDDTIENIALLSEILETNGYSVRKAVNAAMAKTAIAAMLPDVVLLDICMPEVDGYTLCQELKADEVTADVPIIFLSALSDAFDKVKAFDVGGVDYITKPFQMAEVLVRVRNQVLARQTLLTLEQIIKERTKALQIANAQLTQAAYHDQLTDLANRSLLMESIARLLEAVQTDPDYRFAVLFCDCDRFKLINDSYGHFVGDQVLIQVAGRLSQELGTEDVLARFSGDEFVVLLPQVESQAAAIACAEKLIKAIRPGFHLPHGEAFISLSVGIVLSNPVQHQQPEHILRDADIAMYNAKANGKGCYSIFNPIMQQASIELLQVEADLNRAIIAQEFQPYYQPIVDLTTDQPIGCEVLIRWQHPERGLLLPHSFLSVAEETSLLLPIGKQLLEAACQQLREWRQQGKVREDFYLGFNLSVSQITQSTLPEELEQLLNRYGLSPQHLRLEITETALLDNALATEVIRALAERGFHLCIDDFGTGYSSFSYLHKLPVKTLKIDRSFINRLSQKDRDFQIISAILSMASSLNMITVSEGIETPEQLQLLKGLNCNSGQGYWFGKPASAEQMIQQIS